VCYHFERSEKSVVRCVYIININDLNYQNKFTHLLLKTAKGAE